LSNTSGHLPSYFITYPLLVIDFFNDQVDNLPSVIDFFKLIIYLDYWNFIKVDYQFLKPYTSLW
jgi:hypothetical protein